MKNNNTKKPQINQLGEAPIGKLLLQFAIPSIISTLISSLYNMVDQIFIGQRVGYLGNAATTVAYPLTFLCGALTLLFSNGSAVNFNILNGKGRRREAMTFAGNGLTLIIAEGLFLGLVVGLFAPFFCEAVWSNGGCISLCLNLYAHHHHWYSIPCPYRRRNPPYPFGRESKVCAYMFHVWRNLELHTGLPVPFPT
jgi:Na+-driven multidrug efflux pump